MRKAEEKLKMIEVYEYMRKEEMEERLEQLQQWMEEEEVGVITLIGGILMHNINRDFNIHNINRRDFNVCRRASREEGRMLGGGEKVE